MNKTYTLDLSCIDVESILDCLQTQIDSESFDGEDCTELKDLHERVLTLLSDIVR